MPEPQRTLKVFLSYASQDKPVVRELSRRLASEGWIDPWVDEKKLLPGQDWRTKIEEAVETSDVVIICLSSNSVTKEGFVQKELRYAREIAFEKPDETIFLIPLRLDDCTVPRGLRFYQWGDYFGEKKEETYDALLESLKLRYEQKLKLEAEEYARREKAEKERLTLEEKTRKEAEEKSRLESEEQTRRAREEQESKAAEAKARKAAEERARQEAEERARIEKAENERKAAEIAAQEIEKREADEKAKRDAVEKAKWEKAERQAARKAAFAKTLSNSVNALKSTLPKTLPFLKIAGVAGITMVLFWAGSWTVLKFISQIPTPTKTITPSSIPTKILLPTKVLTATAYAGPLPIQITDSRGVKMMLVPGGEFTMGSDNGVSDEKPSHTIRLDSYYMDKYEVTNVLYKACVNAGACQDPHCTSSSTRSSYYSNSEFDNYPVICVDWNQAKSYCEWRGASLPTEAEWEKAARGIDGRTYPWGEGIDCSKANYGGCKNDTTEVGSYQNGKSPYGIYDLAGNVYEWVDDWFNPYPGNTISNSDYGTQLRVLRGGAWIDFFPAEYQRSAHRNHGDPTIYANAFGFRCVQSP